MRDWVDQISCYMEKREEISLPHEDLSEEIHTAALETKKFLEVTDQLELALNSMVEKIEKTNS